MKLFLQNKVKKLIRNFYIICKLSRQPNYFFRYFLPFILLTQKKVYFGIEFYLQQNPDIDPKTISPLLHYMDLGWKEGRNPNQDFDSKYYLETYKDVQDSGINPLLHYIFIGWREGRNPSQELQYIDYVAQHPDILSKNISPITHKHTIGQSGPSRNYSPPCIKFTNEPHVFTKPVTVIIPIYVTSQESYNILSLLINSITESYPTPEHNLTFILLDDFSPTSAVKSNLDDHIFLRRSDVFFLKNESNLGFVQTINRGIDHAPKNTDIVILNSDTEIHGSVFQILQNTCYRTANIASVTPLSNRATIAPLLNWVHGIDNVYSLTAQETSRIIEKAGLVSPDICIPTGHGFCMYISRESIEKVGLLDVETFKQGYGEENDWSMRAIQAGFKHVICTECYVFHYESKSFSTQQKEHLQKEKSRKLLLKYPYYDAMVQKHLREDPIQNHRKFLELLLQENAHANTPRKTLCFIVHDSINNHKGGVQQHIRQLIEELNNSTLEIDIVVVSPINLGSTLYELNFFKLNNIVHLKNLNSDSVIETLHNLNSTIDYLHIHHVYGIEPRLIEWIKSTKVLRKIFTLHDYDLFCVNPYLLDQTGHFCLRDNPHNICSQAVCRGNNKKDLSILTASDIIAVPSNNCKKYTRLLSEDHNIYNKIKVLPHFLDFAETLIKTSSPLRNANIQNKNIIFLGALYPHKGGEIFLKNVKKIKSLGFTPQIWGHADKTLLNKYSPYPQIRPYRNWEELLHLYCENGAHIAILPSLCAETFSYTFYEALFLLEVPVVVGQYGNPAEVVSKYRLGSTIFNEDPNSLLSAIKDIESNYDTYLTAVKNYKNLSLEMFTKKKYIQKYVQLFIEPF